MKGSTHAIIGGVIGAAACAYYLVDLESAAYYATVAVFSALSPDLDGSSMLTAKLGKLSRRIRESGIWTGVAALAALGYVYLDSGRLYPVAAAIAATLALLGFISKEGVIRNALVSAIGGAAIYFGWKAGHAWLIGLGAYIAWVPWLAHRGMTHTIWAIAAWGWIGYALESESGIDGVMLVSVAGYASHLIADTLTPQGVKWLYPLFNKSIKLP